MIIVADQDAGLTLEWQGGAAGVIYQVSGGEPLLYCEFDSTLGSGQIPAALLAQLAQGTRLATLTASAWRDTSGGYQISLAVGAETIDPTGLPVYLDVF
jgi:hypothetical protein